ncbi:flavoprotein [Alkanindiges hydrocarboniclasticus]|uniref:Flavoprotein n=2 Tax=Alkanindiges hydrocarboniclasticus TaxID=1907941 RepID=A0A1S8CSC5_9GAMM|nr:flavoprotein [Alkanindiges hydrocarboniclasticus]
MAAEVLAQAGHMVQVYEQKPSAARKFLMAGKTGLNISHNEAFEQFVQRYDQPEWLKPMLVQCDARWIQDWMQGLGIESYVGSSGRIFPVEMKAAPLLRAWLNRLKAMGVQFFYRHCWTGWQGQQLEFLHQEQVITVEAKAVILATGGGSWARLGSDAAWIPVLQAQDVDIVPLQPSNVGVQVNWSDFMQPLAGQPLKRIKAWVTPDTNADGGVYQGEAVISHYGLEGGLIYRLGRELRQQLEQLQPAIIYLDLLPDVSQTLLAQKLKPMAKQSLNNIWRKAGLDQAKAALLRETLPKADWQNPQQVAAMAKCLPIQVQGFRPIDEAISTAGGVSLAALDDQLMLRRKTGVFCCGEMLDWDAPTGGYLLTACFATGRQAAQGVMHWLAQQ